MSKKLKSVLVTGGMGFIGRSLVEKLISEGKETHVLDKNPNKNLLNGWKKNKKFKFYKIDLLDTKSLGKLPRYDVIYHLAANPEVRLDKAKPIDHFKQNIVGTFNLLEKIKNSKPKTLVFISTSTVYGEAKKIPTPEDYSLEPISIYGASKLACEALVNSYANTFGFKAVIFRLANIVGPESTHGIIFDFIKKLRNNPLSLEVLGDGKQNKSYLYIDDCISAIQFGIKKSKKKVEVFNVGSADRVHVKNIAKLVIDGMNLKKTKISYTGGIDGGKGWKGDVKNMRLDIKKLSSIGWNPRYSSSDSVKLTIKSTLKSKKFSGKEKKDMKLISKISYKQIWRGQERNGI